MRILVDSRESNTALGIKEPECVYVYVPVFVSGVCSFFYAPHNAEEVPALYLYLCICVWYLYLCIWYLH